MNSLETSTAWQHSGVPVLTVRPSARATSLADLATNDICAELAASAVDQGGAGKGPELTALHLAAWCLTETVTAVRAWDDRVLNPRPNQLGVHRSATGEINAIWIETSAPSRAALAGDPASTLATLIGPVVTTVALRARASRRIVTSIAGDALVAGLHTAARGTDAAGRPTWVGDAVDRLDELLPARDRPAPLSCRPDAGPAIQLPSRSVCCVLSARHTDHACPGCPLIPDPADRAADIERWLRDLDDAGFEAVCGRPRFVERRDCPMQ